MKLLAVGQEAVGIAGTWWVAAGQWLVDDRTRPAEIPVDAPEPPLPCVPLC